MWLLLMLPVVLFGVLLGLERVERWMALDSVSPKEASGAVRATTG
jgi:hypothetical protein